MPFNRNVLASGGPVSVGDMVATRAPSCREPQSSPRNPSSERKQVTELPSGYGVNTSQPPGRNPVTAPSHSLLEQRAAPAAPRRFRTGGQPRREAPARPRLGGGANGRLSFLQRRHLRLVVALVCTEPPSTSCRATHRGAFCDGGIRRCWRECRRVSGSGL